MRTPPHHKVWQRGLIKTDWRDNAPLRAELEFLQSGGRTPLPPWHLLLGTAP